MRNEERTYWAVYARWGSMRTWTLLSYTIAVLRRDAARAFVRANPTDRDYLTIRENPDEYKLVRVRIEELV